MKLTLAPDEMTWTDDGRVRFNPGSGVKSAHYTEYVFDAAKLEEALGGRPDAPVTVMVELMSTEVTVRAPSDPDMPSPEGGFEITTHLAEVVEGPSD